jgi:hypothetical protein
MLGSRRASVCALLVVCSGASACSSRAGFPHALSDREFVQLTEGLSEPAGIFTHSENLVSNEKNFVNMMPLLDVPGGVYVGVGPEQNFSYIAAIEPDMAFIVDIRRENRSLHFLYKALFEVSADRAEFVSRLFSRERPPGLGAGVSVEELFARYATTRPSERLKDDTLRLVKERLLEMHVFPLEAGDLRWIEHVLQTFYEDGPEARYEASAENRTPTYRELMTLTDARGLAHSYLATEDRFQSVKDLQARNLIVPLVGDFGGRDALRHVGDYTRAHGSAVHVFYGSNVQVYLTRAQRDAFCDNLEALPTLGRSWFVGNNQMDRFPRKIANCRLP